MASDNQHSLESENISLLHDKILSENNHHFSLDSQLSQRALHTQRTNGDGGRHDQLRSRQISNTKVQRMKPASTAPTTTAATTADMTTRDSSQATPAFTKLMTFHGFPAEVDGDTQPMPSQFYKNYTSIYQPTFTETPANDHDTQMDDATTNQDAQINLMEHWEEPSYHEISSDNENESVTAPADQDETQYFLSSVNRPTFPKTPATAGHKRNRRGDIINTSSTKTPGSGLSAFGFGNGVPLSATQLFQATQAPSSPVPDFPRSDPLLTRPSPNIRHSSPVLGSGGFESPLKHLVSSSRSMNALERLKRPQHQLDGQWDHEDEDKGGERDVDNDDEDGEKENDDFMDHDLFDLEHDLNHSPGNSVDEYDEFAQDIRPSQRQLLSSPRQDAPADEDGNASRKLSPSPPASQHLSNSQRPRPASPPTGQNDEATDFTVADSQPTRTETQPPPPLVEPSSMSSIVPGSYPMVSSQIPAHLEVLRRDSNDSSSIPNPPPLTSQAPARTQQRLPSSPPPLPAAADETPKEEVSRIIPDANDRISSPLPETHAISQRTKELRATSGQQSSAVPETDPVDDENQLPQTQSSNTNHFVPLPKLGAIPTQLAQKTSADIGPNPSNSVEPASQVSRQRASQLKTQDSGPAADSPRKAAGILNFADIAADPTPPDAIKDIDMNIDILSHDDKDFLDVMSSPPQPPVKKMRLYGKKGKIVDKMRKSMQEAKSPQKQQPSRPESLPFEDDQPGNIVDEAASAGEKNTGMHFDEVQQVDDLKRNPASTSIPQAPVPASTSYTPPEDDTSNASSTLAEVQSPISARRTEAPGLQVKASAREALLARRKREAKGPEASNVRGRLVRPKRRDSNSTTRTPNRNRREPVEALKSKLSHVEPVPNTIDRPTTPDVPVAESEEAGANEAAQEEHQPTEANVTEEITMTDGGSEHNEGNLEQENHDESAERANEITQPDRVLALFKGTGQAYYPATCLGASTLDGQKLRVRFDDGTTTRLDSPFVRRLNLRRGDQVKVDLPGLRKIYIVMGFKDKVQNADPDSYPKTDIHGFETIELVAKDRDSTAAPTVESASLVEVPVTSVYLTQTMWKRFDDRHYVPTKTSVGLSSRLQTPAPQLTTPATPGSRSRRMTMLSNLSRPDLASPLPSGRGIFANMAFAVSYSSDDSSVRTEKDRVLALIQANGGLVLEKGFDELFDVQDLSESPEAATPQPKSRVSPAREVNDEDMDDADLLTLAPRAKSLGFVALIADKHSRRAKYVQALALSLPCLAGRWIRDSVSTGHALPWPKYLLPAGESSFLSGAVRSRTLTSYSVATAKLETTVRQRMRLLDEGKVLLVAQSGKARWEARKPYAFLTFALGAKGVRRVVGLEAAKNVLDEESGWKWVYVEGKVEEAKKALFGGAKDGRKRKRIADNQEHNERDGVRVVGDEFVVQSLILGDLVD